MDFIYKLTLIPRLINEDNWTKEEHNIVSEHFQNLVKMKEDGVLLLAGKTAGQDSDTMGLVIFKAESLEQAKMIMNSDPAIKKGIMSGKLWEYNVALLNQDY